MPIHDLGYRHWQGKRTSFAARWLCITRVGVNLAIRSTLVKRFILITWMPALYLSVVFFILGTITDKGSVNEAKIGFIGTVVPDQILASYADRLTDLRPQIWRYIFYELTTAIQLWIALITAGVVGSRLLAEDIKGKSFLLYYSMPITLFEYFLGKAMTIIFFLAVTTILPNLVLYAVSIAFSPSLAVLQETWQIPFDIAICFIVTAIPTTLVVLFFSSLTSEPRYAAFGWTAFIIVGEVFYRVLRISDANIVEGAVNTASLISFKQNIDTLLWKIFNAQDLHLVPSTGPEMRHPVGAAFVVLVVASLVAAGLVRRRLSAPIRK